MNKAVTIASHAQLHVLFAEYGRVHEETIQHTLRVTNLLGEFGSYLGYGEECLLTLQEGALIHDIGKFFLSANMLYSPRSLSKDEFDLIKSHPLLGDVEVTDEGVKAMKEQHHEYLDGTGYPYGLKGNAIHPYAQLLTIVDVYDALSNARAYKKAWSPENIELEMNRHRGTRYNPEYLDAFFAFMKAR